MIKILMSSFEPFGQMELNVSSMVMQKLKPAYKGIIIEKCVLPVLYEESFKILKAAIEEFKPDYIVCMGQAGLREKIRIERVAVNINNAKSADNGGVLKTDDIINTDGETAYFTNLPYRRMYAKAGEENAILSYSAGTYICNDIFYRLMQYIALSGKKIKGGFIHLPFTEHFGKMPYMDLELQLKTVEKMLAVMGDDNE